MEDIHLWGSGGWEGGRKHDEGLLASPRGLRAVQADTLLCIPQQSHLRPQQSHPGFLMIQKNSQSLEGGVGEAMGERKTPILSTLILISQKSWPWVWTASQNTRKEAQAASPTSPLSVGHPG